MSCASPIQEQVIPTASFRPAWNNPTSSVTPEGRIMFTHYAKPATGLPDYSLVKLADGTNVIETYTYDGYGRPTQDVMPKGNTARSIGSDGTLSGAADTTYATTFAYYGLTQTTPFPTACGTGTAVNQAGLLKSKTASGVTPETYVYDVASRPISVTKAAGTTCMTWTSEGRLATSKAPGESTARSYTYDPAGAARTVTDASGTVTLEYDEAGRIKRSVDSFGAQVLYTYDAEGNLIQRKASTSTTGTQYTTSYTYDALGQLAGLTDPAGRAYTFTYDFDGQLHTIQYPNGTFSWLDYNPAGWMTADYNRHGTLPTPLGATAPADSTGSPIVDYAYTAYDKDGKLGSETRTGGSLTTETTSYQYDNLGRLSQVTLPTGIVRTYAYDLDSNRIRIDELNNGTNSTVASYAYDPANANTPGLDELTSVTQGGTTTTFSYDGDGNQTAKGTNSYQWDGRGRLKSFNTTSVSYGFDPLGRARQRTGVDGTITKYLFGGGGAGVFDTDSSLNIQIAPVEGPRGDLAHYAGAPITSSTVTYEYFDKHGDVGAEANQSGARTAAYTYDPFGMSNQSLPTNSRVERWTGRWNKRTDTTSSLVEMGARQYDASIGRFISRDPVQGGSLNSYDFAAQDPINLYDLDGLSTWCSRPTKCHKVGDGSASICEWVHFGYTCYTGLVVPKKLRKDGALSVFITSSAPVGGSWGKPKSRYTVTTVFKGGDVTYTVIPEQHKGGISFDVIWNGVRIAGGLRACAEGAEVGAVAGPEGAVIGCLAVAIAFDIAAENARHGIESNAP